jgi:ribosomal protein S18 acetylase RimI-like enzyme
MNEIKIRKAIAEDVEVLTEICKRAFNSDSEFGEPSPGGPPGYNSVDWNLQCINNRYLQYYSILKDSTIVGGFIVGDRGPGYQVCERIWINPNYMREGIGTKAFELVWKQYPTADLWALGTPEWNTRTKPFYESLGFIQIGITREYPTWNGRYYEKKLGDGIPRAIKKIGDLQEGQQYIVVEGEIETIPEPRTVKSRKTGEDLQVINIPLSDDSSSITLVLWNDQIRQVEENSRIRIENARVSAFRDEPQIGVSKWGILITLR